MGMAIDYRIRYFFDTKPTTDRPTVAAAGIHRAETLGAFSPARLACYKEFLVTHDRYVADLQPQRRQLAQADEEELNRRCVVLALFEQLFRRGPFIETWLDRDPLDPLSIPEQVWILDLCKMSEAFYVGMSDRLTEPYHLNPGFDGSADIGGADGDLILSDTLLDIKATKDPTRGLNVDLYQLLGYALLDYSDAFGLKKVGLYLARYGVFIDWTMRDLLEQMGSPRSLEQHRRELRSLLKGLSNEE